MIFAYHPFLGQLRHVGLNTGYVFDTGTSVVDGFSVYRRESYYVFMHMAVFSDFIVFSATVPHLRQTYLRVGL